MPKINVLFAESVYVWR